MMKIERFSEVGKRWIAMVVALALLLWIQVAGAGSSIDDHFIRAAGKGDLREVKALLEKGAHVNAKTEDGTTALMMAAGWGQIDVVRFFLDKGADVNAASRDGDTALLEASAGGHFEVVKLLRACGAKVTLTIAAMLGESADVERLIEAGSDLNARQGGGWSPLGAAAWRGHTGVMELLLDKGAQIHPPDMPSDRTGIESAFPTRRIAVLGFSLEKGPSIMVENPEALTPFQRAAQGGHANALELLLDRGAETSGRRKDGSAALMWAAFGGKHADAIELLKSHGAEETLVIAAMLGDKEKVTRFIESGEDVNKSGMFGVPALTHAADKGHAAVVKILLEHGADANFKATDGSTALMFAVGSGRVEVARLLLDKGANVNAKHRDGFTALMIATGKAHGQVVDLLLNKGAEVNAKDKNGATALMVAAGKGHADILRLLLENGAEVNARDKDGETALTKAANRGYVNVVNLLRRKGGVNGFDGALFKKINELHWSSRKVTFFDR